MSRLTDKVALITGAGRGIGRAVALKLADEGAHIVVNDLDAGPADETCAAIGTAGGRAISVPGSVTAAGFAERFVQRALDEFGDIHIIVNNAGYTWDSVIQKMSDEQFQAMLDVHVTAPFRILRAASDHIRSVAKTEADAGREVLRKVVNVSSIAGLYGNAGQLNYAAGKAGIVGLTRALCKEWGRYRVNVNCVAFGFIETRLTQALGAEAAHISIEGRELKVGVHERTLEKLTSLVPLGRAGSVAEAAGAIYLLCCPESDYVSGQVLVCGGGLLI